MLRPCASNPAHSRGRLHPLASDPGRNEFQRDRDRIVHSSAFRRLVYKTQVFLNHEGDLFRTRLTHSIEVAQLARSMARALGLHEDLCEAIALAHDLGHTPFGHAGQDVLDECHRAADAENGGFEHNLQSLRVVDHLEQRYPDHDGLNLSFETREGILKHCSRRHALQLEAQEPGGVGRRFLDRTQPSLEAQLCNLADEMAYNAHDLDDGVRSGLLEHEQLLEVALVQRFHDDCLADHPQLTGRRLLYETLRRMLSAQVHDMTSASAALIDRHAPADADAARRLGPLIASSSGMADQVVPLKAFLRTALYRHPRVVDTTDAARQIVKDLFRAYREQPEELPPAHAGRADRLRAIADYIAGMTDRFALREHARLFGVDAVPALLSGISSR